MTEMDSRFEESRHIKVAIHGQIYCWFKSWVREKVVLDAGCGGGFGSAMLAEAAEKVVGIDIEPGIVKQAEDLYPLNNLEFRVMDCRDMIFPPNSFDVVVCNALLEYLTDVKAFMGAAYQVLKPGGLFLCGTKNFELSLKKPDGSPLYSNHLQEFTPAELKSELEVYYTGVKILGQMMGTRPDTYISNGLAHRIEGMLVGTGIKYRFPRSWRNSFRRLITGVDVDAITFNDFDIVEDSLDRSLYIIGCGTKL